MSDVQIRAAEPRDADDLADLFNYPSVVAGTLQLPWRPVQVWRERLAQADPNRHTLVADVEGHVVGWLNLHVEPNPRRRHCAGFGLAVHDTVQGQGIGSALMAAMLDLADNWLGLHRIELSVWTDNPAAIRLYERFGFVIEGTAHDYAFRDGAYVHAHHMARIRPG